MRELERILDSAQHLRPPSCTTEYLALIFRGGGPWTIQKITDIIYLGGGGKTWGWGDGTAEQFAFEIAPHLEMESMHINGIEGEDIEVLHVSETEEEEEHVQFTVFDQELKTLSVSREDAQKLVTYLSEKLGKA